MVKQGFESSNTQRTKKKVTFEELANNYNRQQDLGDQSVRDGILKLFYFCFYCLLIVVSYW